MAANAVTLTFAGDSQSLDKTFKSVQDGAGKTSSAIDKAEHSTRELGDTLDEGSKKFRGGADAIDGLSTAAGAFGLVIPGPIGGALQFTRGIADLADGAATTVIPALKALRVATLATLGPWGLAALAVAALVAGFVVAYKKSETFRNIVNGVVDGVKTAVRGMADVVTKVAGTLFAPYRLAFNAIAGAWNNTVGRLSFKIPGWVPGVGGNGFSVPHIPTFANGGRTNAGPMLVGERGPELFVPSVPGQILTNNQIRSGGDGGNIALDITLRNDDGQVVQQLRKIVRSRGGNVQTVLGSA